MAPLSSIRPLALACGLVFARPSAGSYTLGTATNSKPLNATGCYAPSKDGGWGFCGPISCTNNYDTCVESDGSGGE